MSVGMSILEKFANLLLESTTFLLAGVKYC